MNLNLKGMWAVRALRAYYPDESYNGLPSYMSYAVMREGYSELGRIEGENEQEVFVEWEDTPGIVTVHREHLREWRLFRVKAKAVAYHESVVAENARKRQEYLDDEYRRKELKRQREANKPVPWYMQR